MAKKKLVKINKVANKKPVKKNKIGVALSVVAAGVAVVGTASAIKRKIDRQVDDIMLDDEDFMDFCDCDDSCDDSCDCDCHVDCDCDDSCDDSCDCDCHVDCDCDDACEDSCDCDCHTDK